MKEYEKLAISYSCNFSQFGPLDPITEAYEAGFLINIGIMLRVGSFFASSMAICKALRLEDLGQKEV